MPVDDRAQPPSDCTFCRIVRGEEKAIVVCESADCVAFFPTDPAVLGHTLVVPRKHVRDLWEVTGPLEGSLMAMVIRVGRALQRVLRPDGMNLISSAGEAASQSVLHLHLHVVPRWQGDPVGDIWPPRRSTSEAVKNDIAELVRIQCADEA